MSDTFPRFLADSQLPELYNDPVQLQPIDESIDLMTITCPFGCGAKMVEDAVAWACGSVYWVESCRDKDGVGHDEGPAQSHYCQLLLARKEVIELKVKMAFKTVLKEKVNG